MAAFTEDEHGCIDWHRLDVRAIVSQNGLATIDETLRAECTAWLKQNEYRVDTIDCARGITEFLKTLGALIRWEEKFSSQLEKGNRSLDALNDGFQIDVPATGGVVLELVRPDLILQENRDYLLGMLSIASEHSRRHLACGRRFFTLLVLPDKSPLIGQKISNVGVPHPSDDLFREPEWRAGLREFVSNIKKNPTV